MTTNQNARGVSRGRVLPGVVAVLLGGILICALLGDAPQGGMNDSDAPWHTLIGRHISETGHVPTEDFVCTTSRGSRWTNINWGAQVFFWKVYQRFGPTGMVLLELFLTLGTLAFAWLAFRARSVAVVPGLIFFSLVLRVPFMTRGLRPRDLTFLFVALFLWLLSRPDGKRRLSWPVAALLTAVMCVWNHCHGGHAFGYFLLGTDALGTTLDSWLEGRKGIPRRSLILGGIILIGLASFAFHPHGYRALFHTFTYSRQMSEMVFEFTQELAPTDFTTDMGKSLELAYVCIFTGLLVSSRRLPVRDILLLVVFGHLTLSMNRIGLMLILCGAPVGAWLWSSLFRDDGRWVILPRLEAFLETSWRAVPVALLVTAVLATGQMISSVGPASGGRLDGLFDPKVWPVEAARALRDGKLPGVILPVFHDGGVLGWALYPQRRLYIDGRGDLHSASGAFDRFFRILLMQEGWKKLLDAGKIDLVVMQPKMRLAAMLRDHFGWTVAHDDGLYVILRRPESERATRD